jgi:hypothetical protein
MLFIFMLALKNKLWVKYKIDSIYTLLLDYTGTTRMLNQINPSKGIVNYSHIKV